MRKTFVPLKGFNTWNISMYTIDLVGIDNMTLVDIDGL